MPDSNITDISAPPASANRAPPKWVLPKPGNSFEEVRLFRKQRLAAAFRLFALYGFDHGPAGHITVRDPEWTDHFWINPLGRYFGHIRVSDLQLVDHDGNIVIGEKPINLAGYYIHSAIHKARPEVIGVAHSHSIYGKAWSTLRRVLDPITQDSAGYYGRQALSAFTGVVLSVDQAAKILEDTGNADYIWLENHGILTAGLSVEAAAWHFIALDNAARTQLLAEAAGDVKALSHDVASFTADQFNDRGDGGRRAFQPLYEQIVREQPDLLD